LQSNNQTIAKLRAQEAKKFLLPRYGCQGGFVTGTISAGVIERLFIRN